MLSVLKLGVLVLVKKDARIILLNLLLRRLFALASHSRYTKEQYPTRIQKTTGLLKDCKSRLTIREFWQGVYDVLTVQQQKTKKILQVHHINGWKK
ncbi:MAG: hypothetical protein ACFFC7_13270 [Candidatus Hermodarchaeota archaeon]